MLSKLLYTGIIIMFLASLNTEASPYKITNGKIQTTSVNVLEVLTPTSRLEFTNSDGESISIIATYLGKSDQEIPFASGAVVEQFGLKLRSLNTCNLVYVMRIFNPKPLVSIAYKRNDGMSTHEECGAKGYTTVKNITMQSIEIGSIIHMQAYFTNNVLTYKENGILVWQGPVDFNKKGLSGFRSDNVKVKLIVE